MRRLIGIVLGVSAVIAALTLAGCGGGGGTGTSVKKPKIRVFNASPDSNPIRLDLNTDTLEPAVPYLDASTVFKSKNPATYDVGLFDSISGDSLWAETATVSNNTSYVFIAFGLENFGSETIKRIRTVELSVDLTPPVGNKATLLVFHAFNRGVGLDTPAIDFQNPGDNPQFQLTNITYGNGQSLTVDSGSALTFQARRNGTEQVYATSTPTLDAGGVYLVLVSGIDGAASPQDPQINYFKLN